MNNQTSKEKIIKERIIAKVGEAEIIISGQDCSFSLTIISDYFQEMNLLNRQKSIMALFQDLFSSGELHALTLKTHTKNEFHQTK